MKCLKIAFIAGALTAVAAPALAQIGPDSTQFIDAVQKRDGNTATQLIENHPTIIDTKGPNGDTGLIMAVRSGDSDWTAWLLNKGADPNLQGANGDTPLIAAVKAGFGQGAAWLLGMGAKVDATNRSGETPLIIAVQQRNTPLVKALLQAGADPDRTDTVAGYSARDYALRDSRARDILKLINDKKSKPTSAAAK